MSYFAILKMTLKTEDRIPARTRNDPQQYTTIHNDPKNPTKIHNDPRNNEIMK